MHDLLAALPSLLARVATPTTSNSSDPSSLKIAIITAIGVIIAALITAAATTITRRRDIPVTDGTEDLITELTRRAVTAEAHVSALTARSTSLYARVDELERYCWQNGVDPRTGEAILHAPPPVDEY